MKTQVQKVKDKAQKVVDEITSVKIVAEGKLEAARPALEEAEAALQTIKPGHISTGMDMHFDNFQIKVPWKTSLYFQNLYF